MLTWLVPYRSHHGLFLVVPRRSGPLCNVLLPGIYILLLDVSCCHCALSVSWVLSINTTASDNDSSLLAIWLLHLFRDNLLKLDNICGKVADTLSKFLRSHWALVHHPAKLIFIDINLSNFHVL